MKKKLGVTEFVSEIERVEKYRPGFEKLAEGFICSNENESKIGVTYNLLLRPRSLNPVKAIAMAVCSISFHFIS